MAFCAAGSACGGGALDSYNDRIALAESSFKAGAYAKAAAVYESIVRVDKVKNPYIYYNLSNAYYRKGESGRALLNIERAWRLAPGDKDIRYNLNFLKNITGQAESSFVGVLTYRISSICSLNCASVAVLALFILFCLTLSSYFILRKKIFKTAAIAAAILFLPAVFVLGVKAYNEITVTSAVFVEEGVVRSGPGDSNPELFTAGEGMIARVLSESENWSSIEVNTGGTRQYGWAESSKLEKI